jgi:enoyl-CoA hydratase/carnithine racemase
MFAGEFIDPSAAHHASWDNALADELKDNDAITDFRKKVKAMATLNREGSTYFLTVSEVLDPETVPMMNALLDQVESCSDARSLVLTGSGKFFCNGLNLPVLLELSDEGKKEFDKQVHHFFGRLLGFPLPTVAAINGHAFAGGAILALVCDYRVMREDRGWWCLNEVNVGVPIPASTMAMLVAKLPHKTLREGILCGHRYTGKEALVADIVDAVSSDDELLGQSLELVADMADKDRSIFSTLKRNLYAREMKAFGLSL